MQGRYWLLTIPGHCFVPYQPPGISKIKGQLEEGEGGFTHWQILAVFERGVRLAAVRKCFGPYHAELTRSKAAEKYVWKEETRVAGTQFELGQQPIRRQERRDWDAIWSSAIAGDLLAIPTDIRIRCYTTLKRICGDNVRPVGMERTCTVLWGETGTGKSRRAWEEAGMDGYPKDPNTKVKG